MKKILLLLSLCAIVVISACKKKDPPVAEFTFTTDGTTVNFTSTSTNAETVQWDFGDGKTGDGNTVSHTYDSSGMYTVKLTATNEEGSHTNSKSVTVAAKEKLIRISTSFGEMIMWLYNETPKHKTNFIKLTEEGFYDGVTFHRIIKDFMIQGGDPNSKDSDPSNDGFGGPGYTIPAEIKSTLKHDHGAVGAARTNNPEKASSGSQFYIVENASGAHHLDNQYTVFGFIIKGIEVASQIAVQPKNSSDRPLTDIKMEVDVIEKSKEEIKSEYGYDVK